MAERVQVSDDSVSDVPQQEWNIPASLAKVYVWKSAKMWLDFAR